MTDHNERRYSMFVRLKTFGQGIIGELTPDGEGKKNFDLISQIIKQLDDARSGQHPAPDRGLQTLIESLRLDVQDITRTAAAIDLKEPGFAEAFRPPKNGNAREVVFAAEKIAGQLLPATTDDSAAKDAKDALIAKFVAHEMAATFATDLKSDLDAILKNKENHEWAREHGFGDTKLIEDLVKKGMDAAITLDAIVHNKYRKNVERLGEWHTARHVEADPKRKRNNEPPTPPPPTP